MPEDSERPAYKDPRDEDIMAGDRRLSRPDSSLPDWEVPDTSYRPIPIVWFTAALLAQMLMIAMLFAVLVVMNGIVLTIIAGFGTGGIVAWTWERGMAGAGTGWKSTTLIVLTLNFVLFAAAALNG